MKEGVGPCIRAFRHTCFSSSPQIRGFSFARESCVREEETVGEDYSPTVTALDESMMRRAIMLARQGAGWTNPNPLVGAVVVKDGRVIGEGYHEVYGSLHAERNALAACAEDPAGATLYVTLEPCCHTGKQPPCIEAVIAAGITRVVVGSRDPNPLVSGKGNEALRAAGIEVVEDVLRDRCDALNPVFFHFMTTGRPYVVSKWAMTLDGKIATHSGDSQWVSCEESRADVHLLRHRLAAIMVGINTVLADNPMLTARCDFPTNQPLRVVVDGKLRIPHDCQLVQTANEVPVLVATAVAQAGDRAEELRALGVEVVSLPRPDGEVDLSALIHLLGTRGVDSVLVEGGGTLHEAMFRTGLVDRTIVYLAPKVCGGATAKSPVAGEGIEKMADALELGHPMVERLGDDLKITYLRKDPASERGL